MDNHPRKTKLESSADMTKKNIYISIPPICQHSKKSYDFNTKD